MAYFENHRPAGAAHLLRGVHALVAGIAAWHAGIVNRKALARLTDAELRDIGLSRCETDLLPTSGRES